MAEKLSAQEEAELQALEAKALTAQEEQELAALEAKAQGGEAKEAPATEAEPDGLTSAIGAVGKGLDYLGGATRGLVGMGTGTVSGKEYLDALKGSAFFPSSAEMLERGNFKEGGSLSKSDLLGRIFEDPATSEYGEDTWRPNKGGWLDITGRGAAGFALDMISDPLNWVSFGTAGAAKKAALKAFKKEPTTRAGKALAKIERGAEKAAEAITKPAETVYQAVKKRVPEKAMNALEMVSNAPSKAMTALGKTAYRKGLEPLVELGERKGKDVAETFYRYGIGSVGDAGVKLQKQADLLKELRDKMNLAADARGAAINKEDAWQEAYKVLKDAVDNQEISALDADKMATEWLELYGPGGSPNATKATRWKTDSRQGVSGKTWNEVKTQKPKLTDRVARAWGKGLQEGTEKEVGRTLGAQARADFTRMNSELGDMLTVLEPARAYAGKTQKPLDVLDIAILTGEATVPGFQGWEMFAAKKALDILRTRSAKLRTGRALRKTGESHLFAPTANASLRRAWIDRSSDKKEDEDGEK